MFPQLTSPARALPRLLFIVTLFALSASLMGASGCRSGSDSLEFQERCANGVDDNEDGLIDCEDPQCALYPSCQTAGGEHCYNGRDDNGNGLIDCEEESCQETFVCNADGEDCVNGRDDDGDNLVDCDDDACKTTAACAPGAEDCTNQRDDDGDNLIDCDDDDCKNVFICLLDFEIPDNGVDDDNDGKIDCEDEDYARTILCNENGEICDNAIDDDGDGLVDCSDIDCAATFVCLPLAESCTNGIDDNGDGFTDCDDRLCQGASVCDGEFCLNFIDDDGDGKNDCEDEDCAGISDNLFECLQNAELCDQMGDEDGDGDADCDDSDCARFCGEDCADGLDNDVDGDIDCEDLDCAQDVACAEEICGDGQDNDGDAVIDEGCACVPAAGDRGVCALASIDEVSGECVVAGFEADEASCDGEDNDCDGIVDEGCPCAHAAGDLGACAQAKVDPSTGECLAEGFEAIEQSCGDGVDNDCDGVVDEDCVCDHANGAEGVCAGATISRDSGLCEAPEFEDPESACDQRDNDCDGVTDELCACAHIRGSLGVCQSARVDETTGACEAPGFEPIETSCTGGLDEDCDGDVDCDDSDCAATSACAELACDDDQDNDNDLATDCEDEDCASDPVCLQEVCGDGVDNNGNTVVDEGCPCEYQNIATGVCNNSTRDLTTGDCAVPVDYETTEASCDSKDNNCDGVTDEGCACVHAEGILGVCGAATVDPADGSCKAPFYEADETSCDNQDNDCDGVVDENCACSFAGSTDGVCGQATIDPITGQCETSGYELTEQNCLDNLDNDCDGVINDGCACAHSGGTVGVCSTATIDEVTGQCEAAGYEADESTCSDSLDNDCDGIVDEDCPCTHANGSQGVCSSAQISSQTGLCEAEFYEATEQTCLDNLDNDCDGVTDDGCSCAHPGGTAGVCAMSQISEQTGACEAEFYEATEQTCGDDRDNNCDGTVDENCTCDFAGQTDGVCGMGMIDPASGSCETQNYEASERSCDLLDNDCDGIVDEGCPCAHPQGTQGVCALATISPADGSCQAPGYEANEVTCDDGQDNDCSGQSDCDDQVACSLMTVCVIAPEDCSSNTDEDRDGQIACGDLDCRSDDVYNCLKEICPSSGTGDQDDFNRNGLFGSRDPDCFASFGWAIPHPQEDCTDGIDNDGDTFTDCVDVDCADHHACTGLEDCDDMIDNDNDGDTDCIDTDCAYDYKCARVGEIYCGANGDTTDDDGDGATNCDDSDCGRDPFCHAERCDDYIDNDGDGLTDFADPDCAGYISTNYGEICNDNIDNNNNGRVDCAEFFCMDSSPTCQGETNCSDGLDNNVNGLIDCMDPDCMFACSGMTPPVEKCEELGDEDGDNLADCADPDCATHSKCVYEVCDNGFDDDFNQEADCNDSACASLPICKPEFCGEYGLDPMVPQGPPTLDDNLNGKLGCADPVACNPLNNSLALNCNEEKPKDCEQGVDTNGNGRVGCDEATCHRHIAEGTTNITCTPDSPGEVDCFDGSDDDGDGDIDCADTDCIIANKCPHFESSCDDGVDNDGDGFTDCGDVDCKHDGFCAGEELICDDGIDNDNDSRHDCHDLDCFHDQCQEDCTDGVDNDNNGFVDCEDRGCEGDFACRENICDDGIDNDGDGPPDCLDPDCEFDQLCIENICDDGVDNDGNGLTDCEDPDCEYSNSCIEFDCHDGVDNDNDGDLDCEDKDCEFASGCTEFNCFDGFDDDGDGDIDCLDSDCDFSPDCGETGLCGNSQDDDNDGYTDCDDSECTFDPQCP